MSPAAREDWEGPSFDLICLSIFDRAKSSSYFGALRSPLLVVDVTGVGDYPRWQRRWIRFYHRFSCLAVFTLSWITCSSSLEILLLRWGVGRKHGRTSWDATGEVVVLRELWSLARNEKPVMWYHHCLACPAGVYLAVLDACSGWRAIGDSSSRDSPIFLKKHLCASLGDCGGGVSSRITSAWSVPRLANLCLLQHRKLGWLVWTSRNGLSAFPFKKTNTNM